MTSSPSSPPPSNGGNKKQENVSRSRSLGGPRHKTTSATPLYHPLIFRYTCNGRLRLDSRFPTTGACRGVQSQIEFVDQWRLSSKEEALSVFQQKSALADSDDPDNPMVSSNPHEAAHALQAVYLSNVLVYPSMTDNKNNKVDVTKPTKDIPTTDDNKSSTSATAATTSHEQWSCVGSTDVEFLVLRPQNGTEKHIAAVSPYCAPGVTTRDVVTPDLGRDRTSTIRLGFVEIVHAYQTTDVDSNDTNTTASNENNNIYGKYSSNTTTKDTSDDDNDNNDTNKENSTSEDETKNSTKNNNAARKPWTRTASAGTADVNGKSKNEIKPSYPTKVFQSGKNIMNHMQINSKLIYETLQDGFPTRTYKASERIVSEFDKNYHRTVNMMKRIVNFGLGNDDDDDDDSNGRKRR